MSQILFQMIKDNDLLRVLYTDHLEKYSENVRHFCISLHFYSPRAYNYLRKIFNNHLPHPKTIQKWYAHSDVRGDPGIHEDHMNKLKSIAAEFKERNNRELLCSLVFDEINIRQQIFWSMQQFCFDGYTNYERDHEHRTIAKQAIAFILNGIDISLEFPVAYFFIDTLKATERRHLLQDIITAVTECNVIVTNVTFDGYAPNFLMCEMFGANLNVFSSDFQPFFLNPISNRKIFIFLDPCHMEKLLRNALGTKKVFYYGQNNKIEWRFIESLYNFSKANGMSTHKLTKKHIQWERNSMNVAIACQTFSESVAAAMEYLAKQNHPEFVGSEATVKFIRNINSLFDIFNTKNPSHMNILKRPLCPENHRIIINFFQSIEAYFKEIKFDDEQYVRKKSGKQSEVKSRKMFILKSRRKVGFRGFLISMKSLSLMYDQYVQEEQLLKNIPTYFILQDVIEMFFGRIRSCCGYNSNPNVNQFKGSYRKVVNNMKIDISQHSNCRIFDSDLPPSIYHTNILSVSSRRATVNSKDYEEIYEEQQNIILNEAARMNDIRTADHLIK